MISDVRDETVINIQKIFRFIQSYQYGEAFLLSSKVTLRNDYGDQLFHEWIKALAEFYTCNGKKTAIQLLEKIKPSIFENEIHFRIINSLMCFYLEIGSELDFIKYHKKLSKNMYKINNNELMVRIYDNFANGFFEFKKYKKSLEYCNIGIQLSQKFRTFDFKFSVTMMIKIMNLFYLNQTDKALVLKKEFETFSKLTNNTKDLKYLQNEYEKLLKEVETDEKIFQTFN